MILFLFLYVAYVFAEQKYTRLTITPSILDSYEAELPTGDPVYLNYGVSDFWWEDKTTKWMPWWVKMNMTIPDPFRTDIVEETTVETSEGDNVTTIETSETSEGAQTLSPVETPSQNETATHTDTTVSPEETSLDINSTTEQLVVWTTPAAEEPTKSDMYLPAPEIHDTNLLAQLRAQEGLDAAAAYPQNLVSDKPPPNYDYYGELHDDIPPNVRGPEYPGLSPDIPVILNGTNKKTEERLPAIPGWRLQFPDRPPKKEELSDGTPMTEKTTFEVNYADYLNLINDEMKVEPLPVEWIERPIQPAPNGFQTKDLKSTVTSGFNSLRSMDYPGLRDMPAIPDSIEEQKGLGAYSPVPFKFEEMTGKEFMAQFFSRAGPEGVIMPANNLKAVKAMSPSYTVPHEEPNGTPRTEPSTTTGFTTESITTIRVTSTTEPTTTIKFSSTTEPMKTIEFSFATEPTTTIEFSSATEPITTIGFSTTEPITTISVTSTPQPSRNTEYEFKTHTTLKPVPPLDYKQTYEGDWNRSTLKPDYFNQEIITVPTTTSHPLVEELKKEMVLKQVGYFSVCLNKFFEIFSTKENNALRALLRGGSNALEKLNENHALAGLGPPMWPNTELGFLEMRLAPIEVVKSRANLIYTFYASGTSFDVKKLHDRVDNVYYSKDGEDLMQAVAEFQDFPGVKRDMNANKVMEHLFRALLAPYFRDRYSPKVLKILKDINDKLTIAGKSFYGSGDSRRNTQGNYNHTSTTIYNINNKVANIENNNNKTIDDNDYDDSDDTTEIPVSNFGGNKTYFAVEHKDGIDERKPIYNSYEDIKTEKIESAQVIGDSNEKTKKAKEYDNDSYVRKSIVKGIDPGIVDIKGRKTDSGEKERATKKLHCYDDKCTATGTNALRASKNKYRQNDESKVRLLKDTSYERRGQTGHITETEMGLSVKHKVTEATILYHHDKYINKKPKKYIKSYNNAKIAFRNHDNGLLKHNKDKNIHHTNRTRNVELNDEKWYLEIIKYNKAEAKPHDETYNKINDINSIGKINRKTKYVSGTRKLNCYNNNDECTATDTTAVPKKASRSKYGQHEVGYGNTENKVKPLKGTEDKKRDQIGRHTEGGIGVKHKITEVTKFYHHVKYGNKELNKYPKTYKKVTNSSIKGDDGLSKDIKVNTNYKYYARNGETNENKLYLKSFKNKKSEQKTYAENDNKIRYIKDKINVKSKYFSRTYEEGPTKGLKSKNISKTGDFSYKTTIETYDFESNDYETESNISDKKENNITINGKTELSENKYDDTFDNSVDSKEIKHSKTNVLRKDVPNNKNANRNAYRNSVKAKDYIKELRIRRTTKEKEYFRDIKQYYTTIFSSHGETYQHKKIEKKFYLRTQNHKILSSSAKVDPTQTSKNNATKNVVRRYENKKILEDWTLPRESKIVKNTKIPSHGNTKLSERVLQKRFKLKQNPEAKNNEKHDNFSQSPKPQDVNSEAPDLKPKDLGFKNKKDNILNNLENIKNVSSIKENNKKMWYLSKSKYIVNDDFPYLKERFLDFNRGSGKTKKQYILRNLDKNKNILRDESSYSDDEEVLKSNLQDNLLHGGRNFTDTLHKYKKGNVIRDISSYSDEEDTLKKNIYKSFT